MDSFKKCGFLVSSCFLLITLLGDPAEACMCDHPHPQDYYCRSDFVIRAKFLGKSEESLFTSRYEIKTTKVYKGSKAMPQIRFLSTASDSGLCGYELHEPFGKQEYVITGRLNDNFARIDLCNFIEPWARLSPQQQRGISENYSKGCRCRIKKCYSTECPVETNSQCTWDGSFDSDALNMICLPKSSSNSCSWQSLNS